MKNLKNWLKNNKGAIVSLLTFFLGISDLVFDWIFGDKTIYFMGYNVTAIIIMVISILIAVFTNKFSSSTLQEILDKAKEQYIKDKNNGLTPENRIKIGKKINALEKKKEEITKQNQSIIDNVTLYKIGTVEEQQAYGIYTNQINTLNNQIKVLKKQLGENIEE